MDRSGSVLDQALSLSSADETTAALEERRSAATRFSDNAISQNVVKETATLSVRVAFGRRCGQASTSRLDADGVREAVERAASAARSAPEDPEHVELPGPQDYPRVDAFRASTAEASPEALARKLLPALDAARRRGLRMAGSLQADVARTTVAGSRGLRAAHAATSAFFTGTALTEDSSGWAQRWSADLASLDLQEASSTAMDKAEAARAPRDLEPGDYETVLEAPAVSDLLLFLAWSMGAKAAAEGRSFASGRLGERIAAERVTIRSVPDHPACPGSPFAWDWTAARPVTWVERGVLRTLSAGRWWAREHGIEPASFSNVVMEGGEADLPGLLRGVKRGLLVTRLWYIRFVNPKEMLLTGMTRDGLFWVEDGEIRHAVRNFRFNESVLRVLSAIEALGRPRITCGTEGDSPALVPDARVSSFTFSSRTEF